MSKAPDYGGHPKEHARCGDCRYWYLPIRGDWRCINPKHWGESIEPDDEACSDYEPRGGWRE